MQKVLKASNTNEKIGPIAFISSEQSQINHLEFLRNYLSEITDIGSFFHEIGKYSASNKIFQGISMIAQGHEEIAIEIIEDMRRNQKI